MTFVDRIRGNSLGARALRGTMLTVWGFGFSQGLRLASNLVLTRLLFPEALGLMALVMTVLMGLYMFSDVGVAPSIMQSKRGDDPDFLNTAWTIQGGRGIGLWLATCGFAYPMAWFYDEPQLAMMLPVAGLSLVINGFDPTRMITANRNLHLGRITLLDMATQVIGTIAAVALAWILQSVWALVFSGLVTAAAQLVLNSVFLPGPANRLHWEKEAARELVSFGKWIFLSTMCGFFVSQGDKILMGKYLPLDTFGIYNIGYFLASFPMMLGGMVTRKILIPIYREAPPKESRANFLKLRKMRSLVTVSLLAMIGAAGALGPWLVGFMYDPRYLAAGAMVTLIASMQIPQLIALTYDQAALAAGDSRRFFVLALARATFMLVCLLVGLETYGLVGGILAQGLAGLLVYPVVVWLARHMSVWDPLHDLAGYLAGVALVAMVLALNWSSVMALATQS